MVASLPLRSIGSLPLPEPVIGITGASGRGYSCSDPEVLDGGDNDTVLHTLSQCIAGWSIRSVTGRFIGGGLHVVRQRLRGRKSGCTSGGCQVTPAHQGLQRYRGDSLVCMVAGCGGPQTLRIDTAREDCVVGGFLDASVDRRPRPWKALVTIGKPVDTGFDS